MKIEYILIAVIVVLVIALVRLWVLNRRKETYLFCQARDNEALRDRWFIEYDRVQRYKKKVIELNIEIEHEREKEPIIKYVHDPARVPR